PAEPIAGTLHGGLRRREPCLCLADDALLAIPERQGHLDTKLTAGRPVDIFEGIPATDGHVGHGPDPGALQGDARSLRLHRALARPARVPAPPPCWRRAPGEARCRRPTPAALAAGPRLSPRTARAPRFRRPIAAGILAARPGFAPRSSWPVPIALRAGVDRS